MAGLGVVFLVVLVAACLPCPAEAMEPAVKRYTLEIHNRYRAKQGASNMVKLKWDDKLAKAAQQWANRCVYEHWDGNGENIAWQAGGFLAKDEKGRISRSMENFYNEILHYTYGTDSCSRYGACHYTQIVWAKTTRVGCATKLCNSLANSGYAKQAWFFVCRYDPMGNFVGEVPYEKGPACSAFPNGKCSNGLCISKCDEPCEDTKESCSTWESHGLCEGSYAAFMQKYCRHACGLCRKTKAKSPSGSTQQQQHKSESLMQKETDTVQQNVQACPKCDLNESPTDYNDLVCESTAVFQAYSAKSIKVRADLRPWKKRRFSNHVITVNMPAGCTCELFSQARPANRILVLTKRENLQGTELTLDGDSVVLDFKKDKSLPRRARRAQRACRID